MQDQPSDSKDNQCSQGEGHVSVFTELGDELEGETCRWCNQRSRVPVSKSSEQIERDSARFQNWREPRVSFDDLLYFMDVNPWHRRCVLVKAMLVGGLGWRVEKAGQVILDPVKAVDVEPDHPIVRLPRQPNPDQLESFETLVFRLLVDYYSMGNGFLEVARDRKGRVAELYHMPGRTMRRDSRLAGYWQVKHGQQTRFDVFGTAGPRNEVVHLYQYDPCNDYYGMPDWYAAIGTMALDRTIVEFNTRLFSNSLMANTAVIVEGGRLSAASREAIRTFLRDRAVGAANAGRVLLLEDERDRVKIRFERLSLDIKDVLIVEAQKQFRDTVIAAHGMPPRILGVLTPGQLGVSGEVEGQLRTFRETVLRPGQRMLEAALNAVFHELDPSTSIRFNELDITDVKADGDFFSRMIERGVYTPEEVRALLDVRGG